MKKEHLYILMIIALIASSFLDVSSMKKIGAVVDTMVHTEMNCPY